MTKQRLIILIIILAVASVAGLSFLIVPKILSNDNDTPEETASPTSEIDAGSMIDTFSCITVTIGEDPTTSVNLCFSMLGEYESCIVEYEPANSDTISVSDFEKNIISSVETIYEDNTFFYPAEGEWDLKEPELVAKNGIIHRAYIENLSVNTEYFYRIKSASGETSEIYKFKTQDQDSSFSFILVTDNQGYTERNFEEWGETMKLAAENFGDYDFIVHLGDAVEDGKNLYQWQMMFNSCEDIIKNSTVIDVLGNQDKGNVLDHYTNGGQDDRTALVGGYYSFDIGGVHFAVLDTGDGDKDIPQSQLKWLKNDLKENKEKDIIILMHKAPYSNANHYQDEEIVAIRSQILPLAEKYNVKLVFEGHDHYFFRSLPITSEGAEASYETTTSAIDGIDTELFTIDDGGTIYFMNGSAGCKQHSGTISNDDSILCDKAELMDGPTFSYVTVDENYIIISTYVVLNGNIHLYDSFGIVR